MKALARPTAIAINSIIKLTAAALPHAASREPPISGCAAGKWFRRILKVAELGPRLRQIGRDGLGAADRSDATISEQKDQPDRQGGQERARGCNGDFEMQIAVHDPPSTVGIPYDHKMT
jgi:hypothetical protein